VLVDVLAKFGGTGALGGAALWRVADRGREGARTAATRRRRARPVLKQSATVVRAVRSAGGRPAAIQSRLTPAAICVYDGPPAHALSSRSWAMSSARVRA
jgi:hypothetical protein